MLSGTLRRMKKAPVIAEFEKWGNFMMRSTGGGLTNNPLYRALASSVETGTHTDFAPKVKMSGNRSVQDRIQDHLKDSKVVVYMKGSPSAPSCGFSWKTIQILDALNTQYKTHDVLQDPDIRAGIKKYTGWPTIPQVFIAGDFVGGSDIVEQMARSGELKAILEKTE